MRWDQDLLVRWPRTGRQSRLRWRSRLPEKRGNCDDQSERVSCNDRGGRGGFQRGGSVRIGGCRWNKAATGGEKSARLFLPVDDLKPATFDRLSPRMAQAAHAKAARAPRGGRLRGDSFDDRWNIIYFTGLWPHHTERLVNVFLPLKGDPVWFNSGARSRPCERRGGTRRRNVLRLVPRGGCLPNEGKVQMGAKVDLFEWMFKGPQKRGARGKNCDQCFEAKRSCGCARKGDGIRGRNMHGMRMRKSRRN